MNITIFCGSQPGHDPLYTLHAQLLGALLAARGIGLIYGGGNKGIMGAVANAVLTAGGTVKGIIPELLKSREHAHDSLTELEVVADMHERKRRLYAADAFIILPGGYGTLDELFEAITWNQLVIHDKPILILNTAGFYNTLIQHMHQMQKHGFLYGDWQQAVHVFSTPEELVSSLKQD